MFVTGWIGWYDPKRHRIEYVSAGHEPPIVLQPDGGSSKLQENGNLPLGLSDTERFAKRTHELRPGETVIAYTDGMTDAQNPQNELYGEKRLAEALRLSQQQTPEEILQDLWTSIELFSGPTPPTDDKTCMVIRHQSAAAKNAA